MLTDSILNNIKLKDNGKKIHWTIIIVVSKDNISYYQLFFMYETILTRFPVPFKTIYSVGFLESVLICKLFLYHTLVS